MSSVWIEILIFDMTEILGNIYERDIAILFGNVLFALFEIVETCFLAKTFSKSYFYALFLSEKQQKCF